MLFSVRLSKSLASAIALKGIKKMNTSQSQVISTALPYKMMSFWLGEPTYIVSLEKVKKCMNLTSNSLGVPMLFSTGKNVIRSWLRCGEFYTCHPIDCIDYCNQIVPLPTLKGLKNSDFPSEFDWQLKSSRCCMLVCQAENELKKWIDCYVKKQA